MHGYFITFEGGEGAGKSTQVRLLCEGLRANGREVVETREPGGSAGAEALRELILYKQVPLSLRSQIFAHMAARADHLDTLILPSLARGAFVVCDRYIDSTVVYQGYGLAKGDQKILDLIFSLCRLVNRPPDVTFLLEMSPDQAHARRTLRGGRVDRYEAETQQFHERVAAGYSTLAQREPRRIKRLDATRPVGKISEDILKYVSERLA